MTAINWSEPFPHDGSDKCPEAARNVPCAILTVGVWHGWGNAIVGEDWYWERVTAYRIPAHLVPTTNLQAELLAALESLLSHYVNMSNSGDAGFWDCEEEHEVIQARAAIAKIRGDSK